MPLSLYIQLELIEPSFSRTRMGLAHWSLHRTACCFGVILKFLKAMSNS